MKIRSLQVVGVTLLVIALVAVAIRMKSSPRGITDANGDSPVGKLPRPAVDRTDEASREWRRRDEGLPVLDWDTALRHAKKRNRLELESRMNLLEERVGLSENQALNIRSHMEGWYAAWEARSEADESWTWPDHREITWGRICGSLFVSDDQKSAYRALKQDVETQRKRNTELAESLLSDLEKRTDLASYQGDLLLPFLVAYQTFEQGYGQLDAQAAPWRDGLRAGQFDPVCQLLDEQQLEEFYKVVSGRD